VGTADDGNTNHNLKGDFCMAGKKLIDYPLERVNDPNLELVNVRFGEDFFTANDIEIEKITEKMVFLGRGSYSQRLSKEDIGSMDTYGFCGTCIKGDENRFAELYFLHMMERYVEQSEAIMDRITKTNEALEKIQRVKQT
jgi:hypothetical protein